MKALKFYDKEGNGFELYADHERQSIIMEIEADQDEQQFVEFDDDDIDDIIIAFVNLKNELIAERNVGSN
ncbi:hypothetical protein [Pseudochryseolinea flava]|uniref:Uncharacterized protein n=1 Tax=Pseudochryseolinea flava TaxID=2059302 RepID=A0A364XWF2_9BACT|nr:hypothetical protein [Pseudochryseolinea flava]RAV98519.1 hypothetical protein DQQ10_23660 [Pseudochryseolinea flava]